MFSLEPHRPTTSHRRPMVLVIDDNSAVRRLLHRMLEQRCDVIEAASVHDGLEIMRGRVPALIIIDFDMPGRNGIEGARLIHQMNPHVSVIMLSGSATRDLMLEALKAGVHECLSKPLDINAVRTTVQRYVHAAG